jgi:hypothetical protein
VAPRSRRACRLQPHRPGHRCRLPVADRGRNLRGCPAVPQGRSVLASAVASAVVGAILSPRASLQRRTRCWAGVEIRQDGCDDRECSSPSQIVSATKIGLFTRELPGLDPIGVPASDPRRIRRGEPQNWAKQPPPSGHRMPATRQSVTRRRDPLARQEGERGARDGITLPRLPVGRASLARLPCATPDTFDARVRGQGIDAFAESAGVVEGCFVTHGDSRASRVRAPM